MKALIPCLFLAASAGSAPAATYTFRGGALTIPEQGPADPSFMQVEGVEGDVTRIMVGIEHLQHHYNGDEISIVLTDPDGFAAGIFDRFSCRLSDESFTIDDSGAKSVQEGCSRGSLRGGTFNLKFTNNVSNEFTIPIAPRRPFLKSLAELGRPNPNGRWILWAEDFASGDGGGVTAWTITVETNAP